MIRPPRFGALVTNLLADPDSPQRQGYFVAAVRHQGRGPLPPGTYWRLTDGGGNFWDFHPTRGELAHPGFGRVVEVDEATGLSALAGAESSRVRSHG